MTFLLEKDAKQWWRAYVECRPLILPLFTWEKFHDLFLEKYVPQALCDSTKDKFLALGHGDMSFQPMRPCFLYCLFMIQNY